MDDRARYPDTAGHPTIASMPPLSDLSGDWKTRLDLIVDTMRDMSRHTDPQQMVRAYGERITPLFPNARRLSLSRRDLESPKYRITRSTTWTEEINPWKERDRLPLFAGGLIAEWIYAGEPQIIDELEVPCNEPAAEYLAGCRSVLAIPMFERGESINMVLILREEPGAFQKDEIADIVWRTNLFGRATSNLVLSDELRQANRALDREMKVVGQIQRSLLPAKLPYIAGLDVAAYYQPAQRAGGDYYDFFPLPDGKWGIFIADVSGHGTPAAVFMAVTHCMAHTHPGPANPPGRVLDYLNQHLVDHYTGESGVFITAFYGVFSPAERTLNYASAGHNPPRLKRCQDGSLDSLDGAGGLPLGVRTGVQYPEASRKLQRGDQLIFYTDGITEAHNRDDELFGLERLDLSLKNCKQEAQSLLDEVLQAVEAFADGRPSDDDRTLIVARVS